MLTFILDLEVAFNFCVLYMYKTQYIPKEIEISFQGAFWEWEPRGTRKARRCRSWQRMRWPNQRLAKICHTEVAIITFWTELSGVNGQYWVPFHRWASYCCEGGFSQDRLDYSRLHWGAREDCALQKVCHWAAQFRWWTFVSRIDKHWRLIGWGQIRRGIPVKPTERA